MLRNTIPNITRLQLTANDPAQTAGDTEQIRQSLRQIDRKDSWHWWNAVLVMLLLMAGIAALSLPKLLQPNDAAAYYQLTSAVRGLLALVLIFNIYTLYQRRMLRQLRDHLATQIEIATEQRVRAESFYEMAILDPLTGLYNRRFSEDRLRAEIARAQRTGDPLMVIVFDLDGFKQVNDTLGHAAGDTVLQQFGRRLNKAIRGSDFAVRVGGDEFLLVLPECPPDKVETVLGRIGVAEITVGDTTVFVSSSHGRAQYRPGESPEHLISRADAALYLHKQSRRQAERTIAVAI